jgi:isocitrate/isopropylmalate dehydrogenase
MLFERLGRKRSEPRAVEGAERIACVVEKLVAEARHPTGDLGGRASTAEMGDAMVRAM